MSGKYAVMNPGEYYDFEKAEVEIRLAQARGEAEVPPMFPGMAFPAPRPFTEQEIIAFNSAHNPYDPLYNDPEYARAHGHPGVPAMPGFATFGAMGVQGFPKNIGDAFYYTNDGTEVRLYRNIYPGDLLSNQNAAADFRDVTTPGSDIRIWFMGSECDKFDQNGQKVSHVKGNTRDCYRKIADGSEPMGFTKNMAEWTEYFPEGHATTDADWQRIFEIWDQEVIAGDNTPCWEDVEIGYEVPKTCSPGPITYMHLIAWNNMGRMSLFDRDELRDLKTMKSLYFQDRFGSFLDETALHYGGRNIPGSRMVFYNNTAAEEVYRTVTNWMGNCGRVTKYAWRFFPFFTELRTGPLCADEFNKVPGMEGRDCDRHGSEGDTVIGRAVVIDKYINELGEHIVSLMCWGEDLEGNIIQGCPMEVTLPSKE